MRNVLLTLIVALTIFSGALKADYWQQKVIYDLDVKLIDSLNQLVAHESITYINNSPDDLNFIWMHLWPNAYKNNESALARQKFNQFSTKMHFLPDSSFGWIEIKNVHSGDEELKWEYKSSDTLDVAKFHLFKTLSPGDTIVIDIDFTVNVPNVLSRLGHIGNHFEITQWYPKPAVYDANGWHPISYLDIGEFYSEWGDFEVSITLPENYRVAATGVLQDSAEIIWRDSLAQIGNAYLDSFKMDPAPKLQSLKDLLELKPASSSGLKTVTFIQNNVHDFAWFADKRFIITSDTVQQSTGKKVQAWTYALPENLKNYRFSNVYICDALAYYSDWFMDYPYDHATVVDGDFSAGGGMEYPMITLINNFGLQPILESTIIHEVGHNWFYGLAASNEREHPWMDEGLTSYAENRYWATKYTDNSMLALAEEKPSWYPLVEKLIKDPSKSAVGDLVFYMSALPRMDQAPNLHSEAFSEFNYGMMVYYKSALATESLHAYLGEALMDSAWHEYFRLWAYKHPQPADMRQVFEAVSGEDLSWYFEDMIGSTGRIDYSLDDFSCITRGPDFETTIQVSNLGDFTPPITVTLYGQNESESKTTWVHPSDSNDVFQIKTDFEVQNVVLDPDLHLLDINRANNDKRLNLDFDFMKIALNPQADYVVNFIPDIWFDSVDPIMPGLIISHKNFISWGTDWYLRTFIRPVSHTAGFTASVGKKLFPKKGHEIRLNTRFASDWYYRQAEVNITFRNRDLLLVDDESSWKFSLLAQDLLDDALVVNIDTIRYLDPLAWDSGQYLKASLSYLKTTRRTLWTRKLGLKTSIGVKEGGKPYAKIQSYLNHRKRYSRKGSIRTTLFARYALGDLPKQERFYLSTDMDSDLSRKLVFSRYDDWYTPGHIVLYPDEYTIPGYLYAKDTGLTPSTTGLFGLKIRVDIPKMESINILTGLGMALNENEDELKFIGSLSPVLMLGPLQVIYTPITLESGQIESDWLRFQIAFDMTIAETIRIGI